MVVFGCFCLSYVLSFLYKLILIFLDSLLPGFEKWRGNPHISSVSQFYVSVNTVRLQGRGHTFSEVFVFLVGSVGHPDKALCSRLDVKHILKK